MAGTVSSVTVSTGLKGVDESTRIFSMKYTFVADASAATIPDRSLPQDDDDAIPVNKITAGFIANISVDFGTPAPSALVVTLKDENGIPLIATSSFSADGTYVPSQPVAFVGALTASCSGNSTNSAQGTVVIRLK